MRKLTTTTKNTRISERGMIYSWIVSEIIKFGMYIETHGMFSGYPMILIGYYP